MRSCRQPTGSIRYVDPAPRRLIQLYELTEPAPFETGPRAEPRGFLWMIILTRLASEAGASVPNNIPACRVIQPDCAISSPEGREGRCQLAPISDPVPSTGLARQSRAGLLFDVLAMPTT